MKTIILMFVAFMSACGGAAVTAGGAHVVSKQATEGVVDAGLKRLMLDYWLYLMQQNPVWATTLGDRRFNRAIGDNSLVAIRARQKQNRAWRARAQALRKNHLDLSDQTTLTLFIEQIESSIASEICAFEEWNLSAMSNPLTRWNLLPKQHQIRTVNDGEDYVARLQAIPHSIENAVANLARGAERGMYSNSETTQRIITMVRAQNDKPREELPLYAPALLPRPTWSPGQRAAFADAVQAGVAGVQDALARYADFLSGTVLPYARDEKTSGLEALPSGKACYQARIRHHVGVQKTAQDIHDIGVSEIARIDAEMTALGSTLFSLKTLPDILQTLRTDATLYFVSEKDVQEKARQALATAQAKIPQFFGRLPKAPCTVIKMPSYEAPFSTIAYYRAPFPDGSKPGEYVVNTYRPETRPRYEAEVLAYHEAIPGHHLQIAIAQELPAIPAFRKHTGSTAFVEGWALYSERLADEMGLYTTDLDRMGMLSYDAWRAARLVVDTGIHALGWSRTKAIEYMLAHTALAENNIRNEVDRYIAWPGQALAYKLGQLEILRLRARAQQALGPRFDIRAFHDVILGAGAVSLPVLAARVQAWIDD